MKNFSVVARTIIGFGSLALLMLFMMASGILGLNNLNKYLHQSTEISLPLNSEIKSLPGVLSRINIMVLDHALVLTDEARKATEEQYQQAYEQAKVQLNTAKALSEDDRFDGKVEKELAALEQQLVELDELTQQVFQIDYQVPQLWEQTRLSLTSFLEIFRTYTNDVNTFVTSDDRSVQRTVLSVTTSATLLREDIQAAVRSVNLDEFEGFASKLESTLSRMEKSIERLEKNDKSNAAKISGLTAPAFDAIRGAGGAVDSFRQYLTQKAERELFAEQIRAKNQEIAQTSMQMLAKLDQFNQRSVLAANEGYDSSMNLLYAISAIALLLAVVIGYSVIRSIRKPLGNLLEAIEHIKDGDFRDRLEVRGRNEFSRISKMMNDLIDSLATSMKGINHAAIELNRNASETLQISQQSSDNIKHNRAEIEQASQLIGELELAVQDVSRHSLETMNRVHDISAQANENSAAMQQNINTIDALNQDLTEVNATIAQVHTQSEDINQILVVIQSIADQTNLLALNAAIEAARAGEQGRGFAVVADEVRSLAQKTRDSISSINDMIVQLQQSSTKAVSLVEQSNAKAEICAQQSHQTSGHLDSMAQNILDIGSMAQSIAASSEEQAQVATNINRDVQSIAQVAVQTQQSAEMTAESSENVHQLANEQEALLRRFKFE